MEDLSTDSLMRMQVEQLEREKKELNQRLRSAAKRIDHIERAYRKEERPLLAQDYAEQQAADRIIFDALQRSRIEGSRKAFEADMATKRRLSRMMPDYEQRKESIIARRSEDYKAKLAESQKRIEEEKERRRAAQLEAKEKEKRKREEEERLRREQEEEMARLEAGEHAIYHVRPLFTETCPSERLAAEEAAAAKKREEQEKVAEARRLREEERAKVQEEARKRAEREAEAEARANQRRTESLRGPSQPAKSQDVWRRRDPIPSRTAAVSTPPRAESPALAPPAASGTYRPGMFGRGREAAGGSARTASPVPPARNDDGFEPVPEKKVWKPRRLQGQA